VRQGCKLPWSVPLRLVIKLDSSTAAALEGSVPSAVSRHLLDVLDRLGVKLSPMHPGVSDENLKTYFTSNVPDARVSEIQQELLRTEGVEAAYIKPADALP
jgi:hypothetical protein